jgi:Flp pilus assembly protein TadD
MNSRIIFCLLLIVINISSKAQSAEEFFQQADKAFETRNFELALKKIDLSIDKDSKNLDAYIFKSKILENLKRYEDSDLNYKEALQVFPNNSRIYFNKGMLFYIQKKYDPAIEEMTRAMEYAGDDAAKYNALSNIAMFKHAKRDFEGAFADLKEVYKFDSTDTKVLMNLGVVCGDLGKSEEAISYLERALKYQPTNADLLSNIGFQYQDIGNHEKAIEFFNRGLIQDPEDALCYSNRSYSYLQLGKTDKALDDINKSLKYYPSNSYAYRNRALIYIAMGKTSKACADLEQALKYNFTLNYGNEVLELQKKHCQ